MSDEKTTELEQTGQQVAPVVRVLTRFTFHGGPNDGQQLAFTPRQHQCDIWIGRERYVIRHHDAILLFSPRPDVAAKHPDPRPLMYDPILHE